MAGVVIFRYYMEGGRPFAEEVQYLYQPDDGRSRPVPTPVHAILGGATNSYFWLSGSQLAFDLSGDSPDAMVPTTQPDGSIVTYPIYDESNGYWDLYGHPDRAGVTIITKPAYDLAVQAELDARTLADNRAKAILRWSLSKLRTPASPLSGAYLSPLSPIGVAPIAVFVSDVAGLGITQVKFKLDAVLVNTENLAPWDYFGTDGMGNANRGTFAAGQHTITADITDSSGTFTVSANFEVE